MRRRMLAVLVVAAGVIVLSTSGDASAPGAGAAPATAVATSTTTSPGAPGFDCEPGLFTTVCQIVFAPFCTVHHCYAAASEASTAPAFTCAAGVVGTVCGMVVGVVCHDRCLTAPTATSTGWVWPPVQCAGLIVPACNVAFEVVAIVCRDRCEAAPSATSAAAAPSVGADPGVGVPCPAPASSACAAAVAVICRHGCPMGQGSATPAAPAAAPSRTSEASPGIVCSAQAYLSGQCRLPGLCIRQMCPAGAAVGAGAPAARLAG